MRRARVSQTVSSRPIGQWRRQCTLTREPNRTRLPERPCRSYGGSPVPRRLSSLQSEGRGSWQTTHLSLRDQPKERWDTFRDLFGLQRWNVEAHHRLVLVDQLLHLLRRNRVMDIPGPEHDYTAERRQEFEALVSHFAGRRFKNDIDSLALRRLSNLICPLFGGVIDCHVSSETCKHIQLFLRARQRNKSPNAHDSC